MIAKAVTKWNGNAIARAITRSTTTAQRKRYQSELLGGALNARPFPLPLIFQCGTGNLCYWREHEGQSAFTAKELNNLIHKSILDRILSSRFQASSIQH